MDYIKLGMKIREERINNHLTQESLAAAVELSSVYIGQIERGERKLSLDTLVKVANCLQVSVDGLLIDSIDINVNIKVKELIALIHDKTPEEISLITDMARTILKHTQRNKGL